MTHPTARISPRPADPRLEDLRRWIERDLSLPLVSLNAVSGDASFRRYFRAATTTTCWIAMDAPPEYEDIRPFLHMAELLIQAGVRAPSVHAGNPGAGFLLLEDFGDTRYLDVLDETHADRLYGDALDALFAIQTRIRLDDAMIQTYDRAMLHREMELFREWFVGRFLGLTLTPDEHRILDILWQHLIEAALEQPRVCVHRDYHSRNLMFTPERNPGVLDFQDGVAGPVTYDLVSLLRDCYITWPAARVERWALGHAARLRDARVLLPAVDDARFLRWFDLMGVQRHLKATGIFARLCLRDGKSSYLADIPRTLGHILDAGRNHPECHPFVAFLEDRVMPRLDEALV